MTPLLPLASIDATAAASIATALIAGFFAWYVQAWRYRREASDKATQALRHNRDPLLRASFDLQSRLYNIVAKSFFSYYWQEGDEEERTYARCSTLWLFGQFLGWTEILRREVQYLDLGSRATNQDVQRRLNDVSAALATDSYGRDDTFIVFRSDQRAIGEFMVTERDTQNGKSPDCLGYSEFVESLGRLESLASQSQPEAKNSPVVSWARRFTAEIDNTAEAPHGGISQARLVRVQRRLIDLIDLLDPDRLRYPRPDSRGKLPWTETDRKPRPHQVARFVWSWKGPWDGVDTWAGGRHYECRSTTDGERSYLGRRGLLGGRPEIRVIYEQEMLTICARSARGQKTRSLAGSFRGRRALNDLLDRYDRPLMTDATRRVRATEWSLGKIPRFRPPGEEEHPRQDSNLGPSD